MATRKSTFSPFSTLKIASHEFLRELERQPCPNCCASRKYYCYVCYITVGVDRSLVPTIKLPIKVDIIKHQGELVGKSTATHARILAPEDVTIHVYPAVPDFKDETKVIIVFPAKDAVSLKTLSERHKTDLMHTAESAGTDLFDRVVFVDSTWQQCHKIITDEKLVRLQKVKLENAITHFWRPQRNKPDTCLATIEAIYYFFKEYEEHILLREYDGKYDNLLFFFAFQYNLIQEEQAKRLKAGIQQVPNKAQSSLPWGAYYILSELDGQIRHLQMEHISFAELRKLLKTKPVIPPGEGHLVRISCQFGRPDAFHLQAS